mgnify:CR=1 FL=1
MTCHSLWVKQDSLKTHYSVLQYFDKEIQKDVYKYYVSPLKIRENTEAFKQCLTTLFEYDPEFIKDLEIMKIDEQNTGGFHSIKIDKIQDRIDKRKVNQEYGEKNWRKIKEWKEGSSIKERLWDNGKKKC